MNEFEKAVSKAVHDISAKGYNSDSQVQEWVRAIRRAAKKVLPKKDNAYQKSQHTLFTLFDKEVTHGGFSRKWKVPAFKITKLKPKLKRKLESRVKASASLIKNWEDESIDVVTRRFRGWATSQLTEGASVMDARKVIEEPIKKLPFEARRILIDQSAKLRTALTDVIAEDTGAIAMKWKHLAGDINYKSRPEHVARNDKIFLLKNSWAIKEGKIKKGVAPYYEDLEDPPGQAPFCQCEAIPLYSLRDLPTDWLN